MIPPETGDVQRPSAISQSARTPESPSSVPGTPSTPAANDKAASQTPTVPPSTTPLSEPPLPAALRPDGPFAARFRESKRECSGEEERYLYRKIYDDWQAICRSYKTSGPAADERTVAQRLAGAFASTWEAVPQAPRDPVLCSAIVAHENLGEVGTPHWEAAWQKYVDHRAEYNAVLGDLIPSDLRQSVDDHHARLAYVNGGNATAAQDWQVYSLGLKNRRQQSIRGISSGLGKVDAALGGLQDLTILGGVPGCGKTSLALALSVGALRRHRDLAVLFLSLDMSKATIYDRLYCNVAGVNYRDLLDGSSDEEVQQRLVEAQAELKEALLPRLRVVERPRGTVNGKERLTADTLLKYRSELCKQSGTAKVLFVVDYFQLLEPTDKVLGPLEADQYRVELFKAVQGATRMPEMPAGDPFLVISEVRKGESGRVRLGLEDLMGSSRLSYGAWAVLLLDKPEGQDIDPAAEKVPLVLRIPKGRDGTTRTDIPLLFEHGRSRFHEGSALVTKEQKKAVATKRRPEKQTGPMVNPLGGKVKE